MQLTKIILVISILIFCSTNNALADAGIVISSWQENSDLNDNGKSSQILIKGRIEGLPRGRAISGFSIAFGADENINVKQVVVDNHLSNANGVANDNYYSFTNNRLNFNFPGGKKNGDTIYLGVAYDEKYDKVNSFLRQEEIYVPAFAAGAQTLVTFNFSNSLASTTFNPHITQNGNSFIYRGIVPQNGVHEIIKLTPVQEVWNVTITGKISASQSLRNLVANVPILFQNDRQQVADYKISASTHPIKEEILAREKYQLKSFTFDASAAEILISSTAKITTNVNNRSLVNRNPDDYLQISTENKMLLQSILEQIINQPNPDNIPLYAQIGQFVHQFIKYDLSYTGQLPNLKTIVQNRLGVCTEYARLFTALARLANIPAVTVDGIACGEYDKCQGHSWNMIYYNNDWIEVDPTWDLMSGVVSSSHVYIGDFGQNALDIEYFDHNNSSKVNAEIVLDMKLD